MLRKSACLFFVALTLVSACGRGGSGGGAAAIRYVNGNTIVTDALGPRLIIDARGCQSIQPADGSSPTPVRDAGGRQVCAPQG